MDKYKLKPVNLSIKDGCNITQSKKLKSYQLIPLYHFKKHSSLLLYHSVGSGKTATAINIIKKYNKTHNIILFIKAAVHQTWIQEFNKWGLTDISNIHIYHYDSINGYNEFINSKYKYNKNFYFIDEAHNFINNVYSNNRLNKIKGVGRQIYEYIINDKYKNNSKILLITATPIVNEPYELSLLFNLLKPGVFSLSRSIFNNKYIIEINKEKQINNKKDFQDSINNLVSYYYGAIPNQYAIKKIKYVNVNMSEYQEKIYLYYHLHELNDPVNWDFYKIFSRQTSNFVFPTIKNKINGYSRPRPSTYGGETPEFIDNINYHLNTYEQYLDNINDLDIKNHHTIYDDFKITTDFNKLQRLIIHDKTSKLLKTLYNSSAKFINMICILLKSKGPVIIYTNFTMVEGISALTIYLKYLGYTKYSQQTLEQKYDYKRYVEYHGLVPHNIRDYYCNEFNKKDNIKGRLIKIFFISSAGSEGISLYNVRQIHILEPHWNEVRIQQVNGRGIRLCSHKNLPVKDRNVSIYRYISISKYDISHNIMSTDQYLLHKSKNKEKLNEQFLLAMKEISIDCSLNYEHTKFDVNNKSMECKK